VEGEEGLGEGNGIEKGLESERGRVSREGAVS